ncbi:MAG: hypothetical protein JWM16_33 [Verrucomicrobiales bacterium]|nr:hypothetical protein [Verrucomicrobiales bacterium]
MSKRTNRSILVLLTISIGVLMTSRANEPQPAPVKREIATPQTEVTNKAASLPLQSDSANAALLGRQCAIIWFASETKVFNEQDLQKDILAAPILAKALGVPYKEDQFRKAFEKSERKVTADFDSLFPEMLEKHKNSRIRDIYLFSYWCTACRAFVGLVPLWKEPNQQTTAKRWVSIPLAKAWKIASIYDAASASRCETLGAQSFTEPLNTFELADKFAADVSDMEKTFLSKFMRPEEVLTVTQPLLNRRPGTSSR